MNKNLDTVGHHKPDRSYHYNQRGGESVRTQFAIAEELSYHQIVYEHTKSTRHCSQYLRY